MALHPSAVPDAIIGSLLQLAALMSNHLRSCLHSRGQPVGMLPDVSFAYKYSLECDHCPSGRHSCHL